MSFWRADNLANVVGGYWAGPPVSPGLVVTGLGTDTRTLGPEQVYLALHGERLDGHDFLDHAAEAGAPFAIVDRPCDQRRSVNVAGAKNPSPSPIQDRRGESLETSPARQMPLVIVDDTLKALQALATAYRDVLSGGTSEGGASMGASKGASERGCQVIAVGGSNGKTTTRHLIYQVLTNGRPSNALAAGKKDPRSGGLVGTQSPRSFNNHIGVPLTLLGARADDDFVVVEMGTNHPGEIAALGRIVRPDAAVITSIGREHLEAFGNVQAVADEEYSLLEWLKPGGWSITPRDPPPVYDGPLGLSGSHNRANAALAAAVGRKLGLKAESIRDALANAQPLAGRSSVRMLGQGSAEPDAEAGVKLIDDSYNANPDSIAAALEMLHEIGRSSTRRVAVLGEMAEMGQAGLDAHRQVVDQAAQLADVLILVGRAFADHQGKARYWFESLSAHSIERITRRLHPGDTVLLKGSRSVGLDRLVPMIEARFGS